GEPRQVHHDERRSAGELDAEVAIADRVQTVPRYFIETENACDGFAINAIRSPRERRGTEWQYINSLANVNKPFAIPRQHCTICHASRYVKGEQPAIKAKR